MGRSRIARVGPVVLVILCFASLTACAGGSDGTPDANPLTIEGARIAATEANSKTALAVLEDGRISPEEYISILDKYVECASELDRNFLDRVEDPINGHRIYIPYEYFGPLEDEFSLAYSVCAEDLGLIEIAYINQFEPASNPIVLAETSACLTAKEYNVNGDERNFIDFQEISDLDVDDLVQCGAESSFAHWPNIPFSIG